MKSASQMKLNPSYFRRSRISSRSDFICRRQIYPVRMTDLVEKSTCKRKCFFLVEMAVTEASLRSLLRNLSHCMSLLLRKRWTMVSIPPSKKEKPKPPLKRQFRLFGGDGGNRSFASFVATQPFALYVPFASQKMDYGFDYHPSKKENRNRR